MSSSKQLTSSTSTEESSNEMLKLSDEKNDQVKECDLVLNKNSSVIMKENDEKEISKIISEIDLNSDETMECSVKDDKKESIIHNDNSNNKDEQEIKKRIQVPICEEYHLKWINWNGNKETSNTQIASSNNNNNNNNNNNANKVPIVTQNSNGSCPLLAIINVLLLRNNISFPSIIQIVTASQLMDCLCECILTYVPKNLPEQVRLNYEQNLQDAISIMPRLQTGLDVNVKFTSTMDFEYTPECIIFDLLHIPLYHGWLVDPNQKEIFRIVNNLSYNQLVDKIIASKVSNSNDTEMFLAEEFLKQTASQLTNYGLCQLVNQIKDEELSILFRNNHFVTVYKHKGKLYQLVTDQGFLTEPTVVWESLNNIEGDTYFVDCDFNLVPPKQTALVSNIQQNTINIQQQIDQDYLIALSLEQEQNYDSQHSSKSFDSNNNNNNDTINDDKEQLVALSDEEIARRLQDEEEQLFDQLQNRTMKTQQLVSQSSKKTDILISSSKGQNQTSPIKNNTVYKNLNNNKSSQNKNLIKQKLVAESPSSTNENKQTGINQSNSSNQAKLNSTAIATINNSNDLQQQRNQVTSPSASVSLRESKNKNNCSIF